ncbi:hypothetical protein COV16_02045 [Candidatus Woesearchaeota archaeon CG10_big_fil_rev_8_21_14_0_10_34_8]|nr:MAG: hypothetical protein COV16_02045 [Candidatus Woesearchaeota archaeon CG10_big_fil_rev_8_21_14_0_10_34_8]
MDDKQERFYVLLIVSIIGVFALGALFSNALPSSDVTGAAVRTWEGKAELCKTPYYDSPMTNKITQVLYGSQYPDYCYNDKEASEEPTNNGRYLREYTCENNKIAYHVYDCGSNNCQYGACINDNYKLLD